MKRIKLSTSFPAWPIIRQTPQSKGIWNNYHFIINESIKECDYWIVYEGLESQEHTVCCKENTLFITGEPHNVKTYSKQFLSQFSKVLTSQSEIEHPGIILSQQSLMWMVGAKYINGSWSKNFSKDYDELKKINEYKKNKLISVVLSKKDQTLGHIKKNQFVQKLKKHFGDQLDVFGVGINEIEDKWDAIAEYKYHIVLENCVVDNYWTEKLADVYLGGAYPFYYGCPNLGDYFSNNVFKRIDINNMEESIQIIENSIQNNVYENSIDDIYQAKNLVLEKYNLFPMLITLIEEHEKKERREDLLLLPEQQFSNKLLSSLRMIIGKLKRK